MTSLLPLPFTMSSCELLDLFLCAPTPTVLHTRPSFKMDNSVYYPQEFENYDADYPQEPVDTGYHSSTRSEYPYDNNLLASEPPYAENLTTGSVPSGYLFDNQYTTSYSATSTMDAPAAPLPMHGYDYSQQYSAYAPHTSYEGVSTATSIAAPQNLAEDPYAEPAYYDTPRNSKFSSSPSASSHGKLSYRNTHVADMERKSSNMRATKKAQGPPPSSLTVFPSKVDSSSRRKSRKQFTEEEKKKVEAVRSIGACNECRSRKRTASVTQCSFEICWLTYWLV